MNTRVRMLICILGLLTVSLWSTSAFAQSQLSVASIPRTTATSTGHTEIVGDIQVQSSTTGSSGAGSATLTVDYGVPITVPGTQGTSWSIQICGTGSLAGAGGACPAGGGSLFTNTSSGASGTFQIGGGNQNQLLIVLPTSAAGGSGTISIGQVKVGLAAFTGTKLTATLAVTAGQTFGQYAIQSGQNLTDVISSIAPAFTTVTASSAAAVTGVTLPSGAAPSGAQGTSLGPGTGKGAILTTTTVSDRFFDIDIPENFVDAFKTTAGISGFQNDPNLNITFNNIPNGVFLNLVGGGTGNTTNALCAAASSSNVSFASAGDTALIFTATTAGPFLGSISQPIISNSNTLTTVSFGGVAFNNTLAETIRLRGCIYTSGAVAPLTLGSITASITLAPTGSALQATAPPQIPPNGTNFPRFQNTPINVTIIDILAAKTDLLISFAVRNTGGFDTGIAVANTTIDNLGTANVNSVTGNDGTIQLWFYPQGSGASFTYTTAAGSPGLGLSSSGVLVAGKTWSVGLSELLGAITGAPTSFTGYIIVRANFTNAHGVAYITDYKGFTSGSPFLVFVGTRGSTDENLNQ